MSFNLATILRESALAQPDKPMLRLGPLALTVGPTGSDYSYDGGRTWRRFDTGSFDAVICAPDRSCWASGEQGRVAILRWRPRR